MSQLSTIISQINTRTGYNIPTGSSIIISSSVVLTSGSVNDIVNQINEITGYDIPTTNVTFSSGSNVSSEAIIVYVPTPVSGTISTAGISAGGIIKSEHLLRIINALNGVNPNDIIISGSLTVAGSSTMSTSLNLPFIASEEFLYSLSGSVEGTEEVDGGSF